MQPTGINKRSVLVPILGCATSCHGNGMAVFSVNAYQDTSSKRRGAGSPSIVKCTFRNCCRQPAFVLFVFVDHYFPCLSRKRHLFFFQSLWYNVCPPQMHFEAIWELRLTWMLSATFLLIKLISWQMCWMADVGILRGPNNGLWNTLFISSRRMPCVLPIWSGSWARAVATDQS